MARRILNRRELRDAFDASERREGEDEELEDEDEDAEDEDEEKEDEEEDSDDDDEEAPKKRTRKKPVAKTPRKSRARTPKVTRMRMMWAVYNNSHALVAKYEYPRKDEAYAHAEKLTQDKRSTHFVQPLKEPMDEGDKEKEGEKKTKK